MGRKFLGGILAGFALLAQLMMPAEASRINAQANDPFGHILICVTDDATSAGNSAPGSLPPQHAHHCPLCQIAAAGSLLLGTRSASLAAPYSAARPVAWTVPAGGPPIFGIDRRKPPRGPPSLI